ncbi:MAG TPA: hypothetical protein VF310_14185 [Vicinamibacteria bacterium]|jgi:hypothetical protein
MLKLLNRAVMVLALVGLAGAAQARPSVSVGGGGCDATVAALNAAPTPLVLPRLSQIIGQRIEVPSTPGGFCLAVVNDVGPLRALTFDTNIELGTLDVLPGSTLTRLRVNEDRHRVTVFGGEIRNQVMSIRVIGTSRTRVFITTRRFRVHPAGADE